MKSRMTLALAVAATASLTAMSSPATAQADLSDTEMAHVAVTASEIDIAYAHLALALSDNPEVRAFAETMIRDHTAVNEQVAALARRLGVTARDNALSRQLAIDAQKTKNELSGLRGAAFDRRYAENEWAYHRAVNGVVADAFVPNADNAEVREAFEGALTIFRGHESHAERLARSLGGSR